MPDNDASGVKAAGEQHSLAIGFTKRLFRCPKGHEMLIESPVTWALLHLEMGGFQKSYKFCPWCLDEFLSKVPLMTEVEKQTDG